MNLLFLGDIVGQEGYQSVKNYLSKLKNKLKIDIVIANAENITNGHGISTTDYYNLINLGIDVVTLGNHAMSCPDIEEILESKSNIIRPANYINFPGKGFTSVKTKDNKNVIIINMITNLYMDEQSNCPFNTIEEILSNYDINTPSVAGIFIDLHGTSAFEKLAFGHFCDGKVSAVAGTHTHIPTSDAHILPKGTGYQTDVGMCGVYQSCAGISIKNAIEFFKHKLESYTKIFATGNGAISGTIFEIDDYSKLTSSITKIQLGTEFSNKIITNIKFDQ